MRMVMLLPDGMTQSVMPVSVCIYALMKLMMKKLLLLLMLLQCILVQ